MTKHLDFVSPYLNRPLRSLEEAKADMADDASTACARLVESGQPRRGPSKRSRCVEIQVAPDARQPSQAIMHMVEGMRRGQAR